MENSNDEIITVHTTFNIEKLENVLNSASTEMREINSIDDGN